MRTRNKPAMRDNLPPRIGKGRRTFAPKSYMNSMTELDASLVTWKNGAGSVEAGTLGFSGCEHIYTDACDIGICLHNKKTGLNARFYLTKIEEASGDILFWKFLPIPEDAKRFPKALGVIIWND